MIDIETAGTGFDAAILSIGAVKYRHSGVFDHFYQNIDFRSSVKDFNCTYDESTLQWWAEQKEINPESVLALQKNIVPLDVAIDRFVTWYGTDSMPTWAKGSDFDLVILRSAIANVLKVKPDFHIKAAPWNYRHALCARTLFEIFSDLIPYPASDAIVHDALADAQFQANYMIAIWHMWAEI